VLHNGAVCLLSMASALTAHASGRFAGHAIPFLSFAILACEHVPNLATPKYLTLRLRLYGAICAACDSMGIVGLPTPLPPAEPAPATPATAAAAPAKGAPPAAAKDAKAAGGKDAKNAAPAPAPPPPLALPLDAATATQVLTATPLKVALHVGIARKTLERAEKIIAALRRMYLSDPPVFEATMQLCDAAKAEVAVRRFRYDSFLLAAAAAGDAPATGEGDGAPTPAAAPAAAPTAPGADASVPVRLHPDATARFRDLGMDQPLLPFKALADRSLSASASSGPLRVLALVAALRWGHGARRRVLLHSPPGAETEVAAVLRDAEDAHALEDAEDDAAHHAEAADQKTAEGAAREGATGVSESMTTAAAFLGAEGVKQVARVERRRVISLLATLFDALRPFLTQTAVIAIISHAEHFTNNRGRGAGGSPTRGGISGGGGLAKSSTLFGNQRGRNLFAPLRSALKKGGMANRLPGDDASVPFPESVTRVELSEASLLLPLPLHLSLLPILYSYEQWDEFCFLLHLAEARLAALPLAPASEQARALGAAMTTEVLTSDTPTEEMSRAAIAFHAAAIPEVQLYRRMYELEFGNIAIPTTLPTLLLTPPPPPKPVETAPSPVKGAKAPPPAAAKKGAAAPALAPEPEPEELPAPPALKCSIPTLSPLHFARSSGAPSADALPVIKVSSVQLLAVCEALQECTRLRPRGGTLFMSPAIPAAGRPFLSSTDGSTPELMQTGLGVSLRELLRDAFITVNEYARALQAFKDSKVQAQDPVSAAMVTPVSANKSLIATETLFEIYKCLHSLVSGGEDARVPVELDDPVLRCEIGIRLTSLCLERNDLSRAVQVARSAIDAVQNARDRFTSLSQRFTGGTPDEYALLAHLSFGRSDHLPADWIKLRNELRSITEAACQLTFPPQAIADRQHTDDLPPQVAVGSKSPTWTLQSTLACLHTDAIALWCTAEFRLGAWETQQGAVLKAKQLHMAVEEKKKEETRKRPTRPSSSSALRASSSFLPDDKEGLIIAGLPGAGSSGMKGLPRTVALSEHDESYEDLLLEAIEMQGPGFKGFFPAAGVEARVFAMCGKNYAWRALAHLALLPYRFDEAGRVLEARKAVECLTAAEHQQAFTLRSIWHRLFTSDAEAEDAAGELMELSTEGDRLGKESEGPKSKTSTQKAEKTAPSSKTSANSKVRNFMMAPYVLSRTSSSVTLAPSYHPSPSVAYYVLHAKPYGAGVDVSTTNTDFPGTGAPCHLATTAGSSINNCPHMLGPGLIDFARAAPKDPSMIIPGKTLMTTVSGLVSNEIYVFATGAYTADGTLIGENISPATLPVLAAQPLHLHQLWAYAATEIAKAGLPQVARQAALKVATAYISSSPMRLPSEPGAHAASPYSLRRHLLRWAPRPVVLGLVRCLTIIAEVDADGIPLRRTDACPEEANGLLLPTHDPTIEVTAKKDMRHNMAEPSGLPDADGWMFDTHAEGRYEEGPGSADELAYLASLSQPQRLQFGALRRVGVLALGVELATYLRDPLLMQAIATSCFSASTPLLACSQGGEAHWSLLQPLTVCHEALSRIPKYALFPASEHALARIRFQLLLSALSATSLSQWPSSTRETFVAKAVLGSCLRGLKHDGSFVLGDGDVKTNTTETDTARPAKFQLSFSPSGASFQAFHPLRDYSPWTLESGIGEMSTGIVGPAPALQQAMYGQYESLPSTIISPLSIDLDATNKPRSHADMENLRASLAAFLLWSPSWYESFTRMGLQLPLPKDSSPIAVSPVPTPTKPGKAGAAPVEQLVREPSVDVLAKPVFEFMRQIVGLPMHNAGRNVSQSDAKVDERIYLLEAMSEVWVEMARKKNRFAGIKYILMNYLVTEGDLGIKPPAPEPQLAPPPKGKDAKAAPASIKPGAAKGRDKALSVAEEPPPPAAPPSPPTFHPLFTELLSRSMGSIIVSLTGEGYDEVEESKTLLSVFDTCTAAFKKLIGIGMVSRGYGQMDTIVENKHLLTLLESGMSEGFDLGDNISVEDMRKALEECAGTDVASSILLAVLRPLVLAASVLPKGPIIMTKGSNADSSSAVGNVSPSGLDEDDTERDGVPDNDPAAIANSEAEYRRTLQYISGILMLQSLEDEEADGTQEFEEPTILEGTLKSYRSMARLRSSRSVHTALRSPIIRGDEQTRPSWSMMTLSDRGDIVTPRGRQALLRVSNLDLLRAKALLTRLLAVAQTQSRQEARGESVAASPKAAEESETNVSVGTRSRLVQEQAHFAVFEGAGPGTLPEHLVQLLEPHDTFSDTVRSAEPQYAFDVFVAEVDASPTVLSGVFGVLQLLLAAASDAAVLGRAALAWGTVLAAGKTGWAGITSSWTGAHWFGSYTRGNDPGVEALRIALSNRRASRLDGAENNRGRRRVSDTSNLDGMKSRRASSLVEMKRKASLMSEDRQNSMNARRRAPHDIPALDEEIVSDEFSDSDSGSEESAAGTAMPEFWRKVPAFPSRNLPTEISLLDWRPLWRISLCLIDAIDSMEGRAIETIWLEGQRRKARADAIKKAGMPMVDDVASNPFGESMSDTMSMIDNDVGPESDEDAHSGTEPQAPAAPAINVEGLLRDSADDADDEERLDEEEETEANIAMQQALDGSAATGANKSLSALSHDDLVWISRFLSFTASALLHAQKWSILGPFAERISASSARHIIDLLGGRDFVALSPLPAQPNEAWSAVGGGPIEAPRPDTLSGLASIDLPLMKASLITSLNTWSDQHAQGLLYPTRITGSALAEDCLGIIARLGTYAARIRWTRAHEDVVLARRQLSEAVQSFNSRPSLFVKPKRQRASIVEHQTRIKNEEGHFEQVKEALASRLIRFSGIEASRRLALKRLQRAVSRRMRDMPVPKRQAAIARRLLIRYSAFGDGAGEVYGHAGSSPSKSRTSFHAVSALLPISSQALLPDPGLASEFEAVDSRPSSAAGGGTKALRNLRSAGSTRDPVKAAVRSLLFSPGASYEETMDALKSTIPPLRRRQENVLLVHILSQLGALHYSQANIALRQGNRMDALPFLSRAFRAWEDALDACFSVVGFRHKWREALVSYATNPAAPLDFAAGAKLMERNGVAGCLMAANLCVRLATTADAVRTLASSSIEEMDTDDLSGLLTGDESLNLYLLSAFSIASTFSISSIIHPVRSADFSRHRPSEWVPFVDPFADERFVSLEATMFTVRKTINILQEHGTAFAEKALPLCVLLHYLATYRLGDAAAITESNVLRGRTQLLVGDVEGAVDTLIAIYRCDGLPHLSSCVPVRLEDYIAEAIHPKTPMDSVSVSDDDASDAPLSSPANGAKPGVNAKAAVAPAPKKGAAAVEQPAAPPTAPKSKEVQLCNWKPLPLSAYPRFFNHLQASHPINRASLSWLAADSTDPRTSVAPTLRAVLTSSLTSSICLLRADILASICAATPHVPAQAAMMKILDSSIHSQYALTETFIHTGKHGVLGGNALTPSLIAGSSPTRKIIHGSELFAVPSLDVDRSAAQMSWPLDTSKTAAETSPAPVAIKGKPGQAPAPEDVPAVEVPATLHALAIDISWRDILLERAADILCNALRAVGASQHGIQVEELEQPKPQPPEEAMPEPATAPANGTAAKPAPNKASGATPAAGKAATQQPGAVAPVQTPAETQEATIEKSEYSTSADGPASATIICFLLQKLATVRGVQIDHRRAIYAAEQTLAVLSSSALASVLASSLGTHEKVPSFGHLMGPSSATWFTSRSFIANQWLQLGNPSLALESLRSGIVEADMVASTFWLRKLMLQRGRSLRADGDTEGAVRCFAFVAHSGFPVGQLAEIALKATAGATASAGFELGLMEDAETTSEALTLFADVWLSLSKGQVFNLLRLGDIPELPSQFRKAGMDAGVAALFKSISGASCPAAASAMLLLGAERFQRQRCVALGCDVRYIDSAAEGLLRIDSAIESVLPRARMATDSLFSPSLRRLASVRTQLAQTSFVLLKDPDTFPGETGRTLLLSRTPAAVTSARKFSQALATISMLSSMPPTAAVESLIGLGSSIRLWASGIEAGSSSELDAQERTGPMLTRAETYVLAANEIASASAPHKLDLLEKASCELASLYFHVVSPFFGSLPDPKPVLDEKHAALFATVCAAQALASKIGELQSRASGGKRNALAFATCASAQPVTVVSKDKGVTPAKGASPAPTEGGNQSMDWISSLPCGLVDELKALMISGWKSAEDAISAVSDKVLTIPSVDQALGPASPWHAASLSEAYNRLAGFASDECFDPVVNESAFLLFTAAGKALPEWYREFTFLQSVCTYMGEARHVPAVVAAAETEAVLSTTVKGKSKEKETVATPVVETSPEDLSTSIRIIRIPQCNHRCISILVQPAKRVAPSWATRFHALSGATLVVEEGAADETTECILRLLIGPAPNNEGATDLSSVPSASTNTPAKKDGAAVAPEPTTPADPLTLLIVKAHVDRRRMDEALTTLSGVVRKMSQITDPSLRDAHAKVDGITAPAAHFLPRGYAAAVSSAEEELRKAAIEFLCLLMPVMPESRQRLFIAEAVFEALDAAKTRVRKAVADIRGANESTSTKGSKTAAATESSTDARKIEGHKQASDETRLRDSMARWQAAAGAGADIPPLIVDAHAILLLADAFRALTAPGRSPSIGSAGYGGSIQSLAVIRLFRKIFVE
jgi:hypothetical protein